MRERAGDLAERRHAREMRHLVTLSGKLQFRLFAMCDVHRNAPHEHCLAGSVEFGASTRGNPTCLPVQRQYPILFLVMGMVVVQLSQDLMNAIAIIWIQSLQEQVESQSVRLGEAK